MSTRYTPLYFIKRIALIICLATLAGGLYYKAIQKSPIVCVADGVQDYDASRDKAQILKMFDADHYWLTVNDDYDLGRALDTKSPNRFETRYFGKMPVKVIREGDQVVAWGSYYMATPYEGRILFLSVHANHRKKGLARRLMHYFECDLKRMGAHKVTLYTRTSNKAAHAAYLRMGYDRTHVGDDGFGYYQKSVK